MLGLSNDEPAKNKAFKDKYHLPFDLVCDVDATWSSQVGLYGEQEWKGKKYDGLTRATLVIGPDGRLTTLIRNIPAQDHAAESLKELKTAT